jgi:flagellar basal-body rod protein FlgG
MFHSLYTAATGMSAQQTNLDNIANNLSNSSTAGFRSRRIQFQDMIYQNMATAGAASTQQTTVAAGMVMAGSSGLPSAVTTLPEASN